ncbi:uncharacterized protein LOC116308204 [Actinia tenebrosa]|uniref:Uncharacterized protein LOC116308204 n=1 Tax=Actinia tenebrosa TaxID=6105 RepID=A0A6P8J455_ACTTE|nr:uncharacterized protein LOC116308204 [Actinia tenebrosa]
MVSLVAGGVIAALAFTGANYGGRYLDRLVSGDKNAESNAERKRHDLALEKYQRDVEAWNKKRQAYRDWLDKNYQDKMQADKNFENTDYAFKLYAKAHPTVALKKPDFNNYYQPSKKQKDNTVENRTPTIGFEEKIYSNADCGLFDSVLMAYNWHFNLRTSPDDWWFCVIRRVALSIDENSKNEAVRKRFVEHEGKKELTVVDVSVENIYDVDYPYFFDSMSTLVSRNVKIPEYVDCVTANFTTSTPVKKIVSQITMMSSVQEYFEYNMCIGCGIPAIEMTGTERDWRQLLSKLKDLRSLLQPIEKELGLKEKWWALVQKVFTNLLQTYLGRPDKAWWGHILTYNSQNGSGRAFSMNDDPSGYSGWIVELLEGKVGLEVGQFNSGIVTIPLTITSPDGMSDKAALVSGMVGYTVHGGIGNKRVSIEPFQGWSLLLNKDSPFRQRKPKNRRKEF